MGYSKIFDNEPDEQEEEEEDPYMQWLIDMGYMDAPEVEEEGEITILHDGVSL